MPQVDVVVVGAGVMGAATARSLSRSGREVLVLEQFALGHNRGSSHGASRIFRLSYDDPRYVVMAKEALLLWRDLEEESQRVILTRTGGLDVGGSLELRISALDAAAVPFEVLHGEEAARRFPFLRFDNDEQVLYQADAGIVAAEGAVEAMMASAASNGAEIRERVCVLRLRPRDGAVLVETDAETYDARIAVVTAGAWARSLLRSTGIELTVTPTRETVAYFSLETGDLLPTLVDWRSPALYALPSPGQGMKAGEHHAGPATDPDDQGRVDEASVARLSSWVARRYRSVEPRPHSFETCLYTNTADERFVLERKGPLVIGSPCSGHGFKFAPLIGERLARLAS